jgi:ketosteroid isomerase-like protein
MSEHDEQILRRGFELWNRGDYASLTEIFHPEIEIDATARVLNPARYHGLEGFERLTREIFDIWEEWSIEPKSFLWNGNRALIETRITARGKGSGIRLAETYYSIWTMEGGKGAAMELHVDRDVAYESAGLSTHRSTRRDT